MIRSATMFDRLRPRKVLSRWLLAALLLQCLMPAIASVRAADSARWIEICVSSGVKWVQMADAADAPSAHTAADHCVLCAATGAAPEFDVRPYLSGVSTFAAPSQPDRTPVPTFPAFHQHSRAPPSVS